MKEYEEKKLKLEIKELKKNWFIRTDNLKLVLTAMFLIFTVYFTYKTGILDSRKESLRLEGNRLMEKNAEFIKKKGDLQNEIKLKKDRLLYMRSVNEKIQRRLTESTTNEEKLKIAKLRAENKTEEIIIFYKSKLDSLKMTIIKSKELQNAWTDQDGNVFRDQNGNVLRSQDDNFLTDENGDFVTDENGNRIRIK
jgi:hypothetical protein